MTAWTFNPAPRAVELFSDSVAYASLHVVVHRRWEDTAPGVRTPVDDRLVFELTAGDYCSGPEMLTLDEARTLREMLDKAITLAEARTP